MSLVEVKHEIRAGLSGLKGLNVDLDNDDHIKPSFRANVGSGSSGQVDPETYASMLQLLETESENNDLTEKSTKPLKPQILTVGNVENPCDCDKNIFIDHNYHFYHSNQCKDRLKESNSQLSEYGRDSTLGSKNKFDGKSLSISIQTTDKTASKDRTRVSSFKIVSVSEIKSQLSLDSDAKKVPNEKTTASKPGVPPTPICYPCYDCYCMFTDKAKLREHENSSHPCSLCNAVYCDHCNFSSENPERLKQHTERIHGSVSTKPGISKEESSTSKYLGSASSKLSDDFSKNKIVKPRNSTASNSKQRNISAQILDIFAAAARTTAETSASAVTPATTAVHTSTSVALTSVSDVKPSASDISNSASDVNTSASAVNTSASAVNTSASDEIDNGSISDKNALKHTSTLNNVVSPEKDGFESEKANSAFRPTVITLGNKNFTGKASLPFIENPSDKPSNTAPVINKPVPVNREATAILNKDVTSVKKVLTTQNVKNPRIINSFPEHEKPSPFTNIAPPDPEEASTDPNGDLNEKDKEVAEKSEPEKKKGPEIIIFDGHLPSSYYSGYGLHGNELIFKRNVMSTNLTQEQPLQTSVKKAGQKRSNSFEAAQATQSKRPSVELYSRKELKSNFPKVSGPLLIQPSSVVNSQSKSKNILQNKKTVSLLSHLEPDQLTTDPLAMDSFISCNLDSENGFNLQNELKNKEVNTASIDVDTSKPQKTITISNPLKGRRTVNTYNYSFELSAPNEIRLHTGSSVKEIRLAVPIVQEKSVVAHKNSQENGPTNIDADNIDPDGPTIVSVTSLKDKSDSELSPEKVRGFIESNNIVVPRFKCDKCDHVCKSQVVLWHHLEEKHNKIKCDQCGELLLRDSMRYHKRKFH